MTGIFLLLRSTWKIWLPILLIVGTAGTIWAQNARINSLKNQRDVAIVEHDKAMEEQRQLLADIDRLNRVLVQKKMLEQRLGAQLEDAKNRIRNLANNRPDVADWRNASLPSGLWAAVNNSSPSPDPPDPDTTDTHPSSHPDDQR